MRRLLLLVALAAALTATPALPSSGSTLSRRLDGALRGPGLDPTRTGALVVDLATGRTVYALHPGRALVPASNEKLPLTYALLLELGPSFRIATQVLGEGRLVGTTWRGSLVLRGEGDPTLTSADLRRLAARLRRLGIRRVTGSVVGDESYFDRNRIGPGWKWSFYRNESPALSALVVDRGETPGGQARKPALAAAGSFRRALRQAGIRVDGPAKAVRAGGRPLTRVVSAPLASILETMDSESDNFDAEMLLKVLGAVAGGRGSTAVGAKVVRRTLAEHEVPLAGMRLADGSGLSSLDRLTPRSLAAVLVHAWQDRTVRPFFTGALAVPGKGTLQHRLLSPHVRGAVRAKTGTTDVASALSGYVRDRCAFVVLENGAPVSTWAAHAAQDRFVSLLAAQ